MFVTADLAFLNVSHCTHSAYIPLSNDLSRTATAAFIPEVSLKGKGPISGVTEGIPVRSPYLSPRMASVKFARTVGGSLLQKESNNARRKSAINSRSPEQMSIIGSLPMMFLK
jgi:hypothetical protein